MDGAGATTVVAYDVWFDQWTPNDTGTLIHCWWFDSTNDIVRWRTLDTNGDGLGTVRVVLTATSAVAGRGAFVSGTKTRSGYLYCAFDIDAGAERGLHRSTDSGTTWSANLATTFVEATLDTCQLLPASNTGDNNDCWAVYYDASATALTLKLWDSSAGSSVESATIQTHTDGVTDLTGQFGYNASIRHSDGHIILAAVSLRDNASSTHQVYDIADTSTITEKTAITTNIDDHYYPQVFIDQLSGDIYVTYNGKRDGSETLDTTSKVYYTKSTDGGATWSANDAAYMEGAAGIVQQVWTSPMGPRFYAGWRVGTTLLGNFVNSVALTAKTLTMSAGALASVGQVLTLALSTAVGLGSLGVTGQSVGMAFTGPAQGTLTLTGQAPTVSVGAGGLSIPVPVGTLSTTGRAPTLGFGAAFTPGSIGLTGQVPVSVVGGGAQTLPVPAGTLDVTGHAVTLGLATGVTPGSLSLTGQSVSLALSLPMPGGSLSLTGGAPTLTFGQAVPGGTVSLTGLVPTVTSSAPGLIAIPAGSLALVGQSVGVAFLGPAVGSLGLTGLVPTLSLVTPIVIAVPVGSLTVSGQYVAIVFLVPPAGQLNLTGRAPTVVISGTDAITIPVGSVSYTPRQETLAFGHAMPVGTVSLSGQAPSTGGAVGIQVPVGALGLTPRTAALAVGMAVPSGALNLTAGSASLAVADAVPVGSVSLTGQAPALSFFGQTVIPVPVGTASLTGFAPTLVFFGETLIPVPVGTLTLTPGSLTLADRLSLLVGSLSLSGAVPSLASGLTSAVGSVSLSGQVPTLAFFGQTVIPVPAGTLDLTGRTATQASTALVPVGSVSLSGQAALRLVSTPRLPGVGSVSLTGQAPFAQIGVGVPVGTLALTGLSLSVNGASGVSLPVGSTALTGRAPTVLLDKAIPVGVGTVALTGSALTLVGVTTVPSGSVSLTGHALIVNPFQAQPTEFVEVPAQDRWIVVPAQGRWFVV